MCLACWDADERKEALTRDDCDGHLTPFMTVEELKARIVKKWHKTKKTSHIVYKEAIINPPEQGMEWTETFNSDPATLKVKFINF
jgi:hypothetical protein